ncbi:MAG: hypothetical protein ACP5E5_08975 [Acidobacteriaceae bacterium]
MLGGIHCRGVFLTPAVFGRDRNAQAAASGCAALGRSVTDSAYATPAMSAESYEVDEVNEVRGAGRPADR